MKARRLLVVGALSAAMLTASAAAASAHAILVETPSGQEHFQVLHSGNGALPPHSGAFKFHVTCNVNGSNPAIFIGGPSSCG